MSRIKQIQAILFILSKIIFLIFISSGCGTLWTSRGQYSSVGRMLEEGDFSAAAAQIQRSQHTHYRSKDRVLYLLDLGLLQHYMGEYEKSNASLEEAERLIEEAFTVSISRGAATLLLNDNAQTYRGTDYEDVYINGFKALNYIALDQADNAFIEIRRIDEKLKILEDRHWKIAQKYNTACETDKEFAPAKNHFQNSAFGRWLSLLLYRAENRWDDARIDIEKIRAAWALQPAVYNFSAPEFSSALTPAAGGNVKVSFLSFTGQAPEKRANTLYIHTQADQIFIAGLEDSDYGKNLAGFASLHWPGIEPGYTFKFQLPYIYKHGSNVRRIVININGKNGWQMQRIESLENVAAETFAVQKPVIYLKTVTRTVVKGIGAAQAQNVVENHWGESHGLIAGLLAGVAVGVTENADLRISRFFPAEAHIAEIELPPGLYQIDVVYYGANGNLLYTDRRNGVEIRRDGLNFIESVYLN
ncbi:MAG: hypothetical protein WC959_10435 [Kiritimatiellales bacterium]